MGRSSPAVGISDLTSTGIAEVMDGTVAPTSRTWGVAVRVVNGGINVGSTAFRVTNSTAQRIPVSLPSTTIIFSGDVEVKNDTGNPIPVTHPSLDITLSALRDAIAGGVSPKTLADVFATLGLIYTRQGNGANVVAQGAPGAASWPVTSTSMKLAAGSATVGTVVLSSGSLAALESITVQNTTAQRVPVTSTGTVGLNAVTLAALESITVQNGTAARIPVTSTGTVGLNAAALAALENISVQNGTAASIPVAEQNQLVPKKFGYIALTYSTFAGTTSSKLTQAVYHSGSSTTATVATLTLRYSTALQLASVGRT